MSDTPNDFEVKEAWQKFLKTPEAAELQHTQKNSNLLHREVLAGDLDYSCKALQLAARKLHDALDLKPSQTSRAADVSTPREASVVTAQAKSDTEAYDESKDPNFPRRAPHEPGHIYQGRVNFYRESRAQAAWRDRENKRLLEAPPAQSTINRTKLDIKLRRLEQENWNLKKSNQS